jgi:DNA-binding NarL/FixJ family response regulator
MAASSLRYRVLIVDDAPPVREALRWALEAEPELEVVGEAGSGRAALEGALALAPDVVILDVGLPDVDGFTVARTLKASATSPLVIFLTIYCDPLSRARAAEVGGDAFVEKGSGWPALIAQVRQALNR